jgi:uncharacterized protein
MGITYDPQKCARNIRERGLSFEVAEGFEWNGAYVIGDTGKDYGERRFQALGEIGGRVYMLVFTPRGRDVHVISIRKANRREIRRYEEERAIEDE